MTVVERTFSIALQCISNFTAVRWKIHCYVLFYGFTSNAKKGGANTQ